MKWYLNDNREYRDFADRYFDEFKQQLKGFVRQNHPLVISLEKSGYPGALHEAEKFKAFFDTKTFRGVGFEFKNGKGVDFGEDVETYNKNRKDVKHTLEWFPETKTTCPAIYVRPEKWQEPSTPEESEKWLDEFVRDVPRLTILKEELKREAKRILAGKSEPKDEDEKRKRKKAVKALMEAIDALEKDDWKVVLGIETVEDKYEVATKDGEPILLLDENASILKGPEADFALRLCNGFPLSKEQRDAFCKFVEWATEQLCKYHDREDKSSPCIKAVLRFFLSWPDMNLYDLIHWHYEVAHFMISDISMDSWHFTFGQLVNGYKEEIDWYDSSFKGVNNKDTGKSIEREDYEDVTKQWVKKNDSLRNVADRKKLAKRFEMFLGTLKGFTDWDTEGGTIKDWEKYQSDRLEKYKDLTKDDNNLPESLTTWKAIRDAEKE